MTTDLDTSVQVGESVIAEPERPPTTAFGLEAFTQDDRLRLFAFATAEKNRHYLWTLRAIEHSRPTT